MTDADAPAGGDTGAVTTPAVATAPTQQPAQPPQQPPQPPQQPQQPQQPQPRQPPAASPARAATQHELLEVHRRARQLLAMIRERSAGGKSKSGRYKAHDTTRRHVLDTTVSKSPHRPSPHLLIIS